jgi:hypothetical protein
MASEATEGTSSNETPAALPDSATVEEVMQGGWMAGLAVDEEAPPPVNPNTRPRKEGDEIDKPDPDSPQPEVAAADEPEVDPEDPDAPQPEPEPEPEPEAAAIDAPEFWSAEDKAILAALPKAVSSTVRKYEQQRIAFVNEQARKAAEGVKEARDVATKLYTNLEQQAAWWQQNGPAFAERFADKWSKINWNKLAAEDPGEWARLKQEHADETALLGEAKRRGEANIAAAQARQAEEQSARIQTQKAESHAALLKKYPKDFANPDEIYNKKLGPFLLEMGVDVERINQISELPILEIAYLGYLQHVGQKAKAQAKQTAAAVLDPKKAGAQPQPNPAPATPTRVTPGAPARAANRSSEAHRQVSARFRQTGDVKDAAALIQHLNL